MGKCKAKQWDRRGQDLRWVKIVFLLACLSVMFVLNYTSILKKTFTYDEPWHLRAALGFVQGVHPGPSAHMPSSALNAAPVMLLASVPREESALEDFALRLKGAPLVAARLMTSLCSLILGAIVYLWAHRLYGPFGGGLSLLLYTFSPNLLAHSRLITTDLFATLMITASLYSFWAFLNRSGWKRGLVSSTVLGASQLAKYSCVFLYPLFLLLTFLRWISEIRGSSRSVIRADNVRKATGYLALFLSASVAMVQAGYLFHDVYRPLSSYQFESQMFQRVQAQLGAISSLPVPLPYRYLKGLDAVIFHEPTGLHQGRVYLRGERRKGAGFLTYYLVAVLFKVPIAGLILFGAALVDLWSKRRSEKFWHNEIVLLLPCLFFFLYLSCFFNAQFGLRYLLPAFPLGFIFCGRLGSGWRRLAARRKALLVLLVLYFGSSSLSYHPHYLSYFNEFSRVVLDMDSTESPVHGQQEVSAYNGHFESVCYHPLLLFNGLPR